MARNFITITDYRDGVAKSVQITPVGAAISRAEVTPISSLAGDETYVRFLDQMSDQRRWGAWRPMRADVEVGRGLVADEISSRTDWPQKLQDSLLNQLWGDDLRPSPNNSASSASHGAVSRPNTFSKRNAAYRSTSGYRLFPDEPTKAPLRERLEMGRN